ncbi:hypothetical protein OESDEN_00523 [Oesophagostomum dentatum]|uniref:Uncharacterized protein n=1 Tax=Oesophagostomum dentatum TaxID=61180 RepID=A0A0B1TUF2_OESDE|nr:hypothetical protein OESDEN_00523 [Oesophagostomum dentatum]
MAMATRVHVPIGTSTSADSGQPSILYVHTKNYAPPKSQQAQRMYISATLNPIFYNLMSTRFRAAFTQLLHQILPKRDQDYGSLARM